jgi:DNA invertase Pin-like site-specific DNA recombinase
MHRIVGGMTSHEQDSPMRPIGYARVSTVQQNLDRQLGALRTAGCKVIYAEKASGRDVKGRPELERAIDALGTGDVLVLAEWDRATRSMMDGIAIMQRVHARGGSIKVLDKPHLDLTTKIGQGFLAFLSALAEDERERIHKRAVEGRKAARNAGRRFGRKPKLNATQQTRARELVRQGWGLRRIAAEMNVHHSTIARLR